MTNIDGFSGCERCGRFVNPQELWTLTVTLPADGPVERRVCVVCAADVRRFLLAQPAATAIGDGDTVEHVELLSRRSRFGWFLTRWTIYAFVALLAFIGVTWVLAR
jgi:hypothetical protein